MSFHQFFAACPKGLESLLFEELTSLGAKDVRETLAGVYFSGESIDLYRACLWSRLANKVLFPLTSVHISNEADLYTSIHNIDWESHLAVDGTFKVDFIGTDDNIRNTQFGAVRVKDAIVDRFQEREGARPSVSKQNPDLIINVRLSRSQGKTKVNISLDLSGQSLHRRGYRHKQGAAPLKENLACAVLLRSNWPSIAEQGGYLIDPMCGSATLLIEGFMMAADIAPGLLRKSYDWGFERWLKFDALAWSQLVDEARVRKQQGLDKLRESGFECRGYDQDWKVLRAAEENIERAGYQDFIRVSCKPISELIKPTHKTMEKGLIICNPPYGERLGEVKLLEPVYQRLGELLRSDFIGWHAGVITSNWQLAQKIGLRAKKKYKFWNGTLSAELLAFDIDPDSFYKETKNQVSNSHNSDEVDKSRLGFEDLSDGAKMVCNRIRKNQKQLRSWLKKDTIECYRVYDADIPEYAVAVDIYGDSVHVQEYKAPKTIDEQKSIKRFQDCLDAINVALNVDNSELYIKQRRQNKGKQQYEKLQEEYEHRAALRVTEGPAIFLVNLWSYLDTGLFLDHRPVRKKINAFFNGTDKSELKPTKPKSFLNLFCYTATASVQAALGGAESSVSVDMSRTYIDWAKENYEANHISLTRHELVQQDCLVWLEQCRQGFDVILLDPPSFSNSKRMDKVLDIQRDHVSLIQRCMEILNHNGVLIFSNNLRSFKLDSELENTFNIKNVSQQTLDPDFQRNPKIHHCWLIASK